MRGFRDPSSFSRAEGPRWLSRMPSLMLSRLVSVLETFLKTHCRSRVSRALMRACAPLCSPPRPEQPPAAPASPPRVAHSGPASQPAPGAPRFWFVGPSWSHACQSSQEPHRDNDRMRNRADCPRPHESDGFQVNEILITCHRCLLFLYIYDNLGGGSFFFIEVGVD